MTWDEKMKVGMALMAEACFESEDEERYPCDRCPATRYCAILHEVAEARNLPRISHWDEFNPTK